MDAMLILPHLSGQCITNIAGLACTTMQLLYCTGIRYRFQYTNTYNIYYIYTIYCASYC